MRWTLHHQIVRALLSLLAVVLLALPAAAAEKTDVSGEWDITITSENGNFTPRATLEQQGDKLKGQYHGTFGESKLEGSVNDKKIEWKTTVNAQGQSVQVVYRGTIEDDGTLKGTVEFGDFGSGQWTAKRKSAAAKERK